VALAKPGIGLAVLMSLESTLYATTEAFETGRSFESITVPDIVLSRASNTKLTFDKVCPLSTLTLFSGSHGIPGAFAPTEYSPALTFREYAPAESVMVPAPILLLLGL